MIERLLSRIARLAVTRPRSVLAASVVPALLSLYAFGVPLDLSFAGVMDRSHPEVVRYFEASERYGLGGLLPLLVEGPEEQLDAAAEALALVLEARPEVRSVVTGPPEEWLRERAPYLVPREIFDDWTALASSSLAGGSARNERRGERIAAALDELGQQHMQTRRDGARLVLVTLTSDGFELALDAVDFPTLRALSEETLAAFGVQASFAGMPAIVTQEQEATIARLRFLGPASLLLAVLLLLSFERRPFVLASAALPMLLAVGCTLGLIGAIAGNLTIMESVFGVLVFGLGIDFAIHLLLRVREERDAGRDFEQSIASAVTGTGRGIAAGAVTTGGAFLILTLSPDPVFRRLGLAGGLGLLLCSVFLMSLLPAALAWHEQRALAREPNEPAGQTGPSLGRTPTALLARTAAGAARAPWVTLLIAAAALVAITALTPPIRYETNIERVFSRDIEAVSTARRIHELFAVDPGPWLVVADDLAEARRVGEALAADPVFARSESLGALFPPDMQERHERLQSLSRPLSVSLQQAERSLAASPTGIASARREELQPLRMLLEAERLGPPSIDTLPAELADRFVGPDGELLVYAFVEEPAIDSAVAARERRAAQAIAPSATSMSSIYEALLGTDRPWIPKILGLLFAFIAVVLLLDLRSVRLVCLTLVPVTSATLLTVGLLSAFGFSFNTLTLVGIPLLLGLGVDDGIHVVHRLLERPEEPLERSVGAVARSIAMTTITSCTGVALLVFTRHPGIESIAILLLVGLPLCLFASVTLLPAVAVLLGAPGLAARRALARS